MTSKTKLILSATVATSVALLGVAGNILPVNAGVFDGVTTNNEYEDYTTANSGSGAYDATGYAGIGFGVAGYMTLDEVPNFDFGYQAAGSKTSFPLKDAAPRDDRLLKVSNIKDTTPWSVSAQLGNFNDLDAANGNNISLALSANDMSYSNDGSSYRLGSNLSSSGDLNTRLNSIYGLTVNTGISLIPGGSPVNIFSGNASKEGSISFNSQQSALLNIVPSQQKPGLHKAPITWTLQSGQANGNA